MIKTKLFSVLDTKKNTINLTNTKSYKFIIHLFFKFYWNSPVEQTFPMKMATHWNIQGSIT